MNARNIFWHGQIRGDHLNRTARRIGEGKGEGVESCVISSDQDEVAQLSPRQFSRAFRAETGRSPARAVERLRLEAARLMLEQSQQVIEKIANQTGVSDSRLMREALLRAFGQPSQAIRRNARTAVNTVGADRLA